jgi:hypothetical protein
MDIDRVAIGRNPPEEVKLEIERARRESPRS